MTHIFPPRKILLPADLSATSMVGRMSTTPTEQIVLWAKPPLLVAPKSMSDE